MQTFVDYAFYRDEYHGQLTEDEFATQAARAYAEILSQTNGQALQAPDSMQDNLALCECELVDALHAFAQVPKGVSSVNNDGYSVSFGGDAAGCDEAAGLRDICARYLQVPVNLMCRWL